MKLTPKQELFITEYIIDSNATQAAIRSGYSKRSAMQIGEQNLRKHEIKCKIDEHMKQRALDNGVTADMVLKDLLELKDKCLGRKPIRLTHTNKDGNYEIIEKVIFDASGAKASLELLGKHLKLFVDKVETENTNTNLEIKLDENLSDWAK